MASSIQYEEVVAPQERTLPVCLWRENPYGLVSLLDMLRLHAHEFVSISNSLGQIIMDIGSGREPRDGTIHAVSHACGRLEGYCQDLGLTISLAQLRRLRDEVIRTGVSYDDVRRAIIEIQQRVYDELEQHQFLAIEQSREVFFNEPMRGWESVIRRFPSASDDIAECAKCYALERYAASIFHAMRITEVGVLALGKLVDPDDYKPQFSSVLKKLDNLTQKTKYQDWPASAQPHKPLFVEVLPRLHATKDSWRDKVSHAESHIIPTAGASNGERALDVFNATLSLMRLLAERLP